MGQYQSLEDFLTELKKLPRQPFKPFVWHNRGGDTDILEIFLSDEEGFSEYINPQICVRRSFQDRSKIIGVQVWGAKSLIEGKDSAVPPE